MTKTGSTSHKYTIKVKVRLFAMPPIHDALVLGKTSPIGCVATRQAIDLLVAEPFVHIEIHDDEVISDILIRKSILKRCPESMLKEFVLDEVKPLMSETEILHIDIDPEVLVQKSL